MDGGLYGFGHNPLAALAERPSDTGDRRLSDITPKSKRDGSSREGNRKGGSHTSRGKKQKKRSHRNKRGSAPKGSPVQRVTSDSKRNKQRDSTSAIFNADELSEDESETKAALLLQSIYRRKKLVAVLAKRVKKAKQRKAVMMEIYTTERSYVKALKDADKFHNHLRECGAIQTLPDLLLMFRQMQDIANLHELLLMKITPMMEHGSFDRLFRETFTHMILDFAPRVGEVYSPFLYGREKALKLLGQKIKTDKKLMSSIELVENENNTRRGMAYLDSLTVAPVQRLPRYNLLLGELIKALPKEGLELQNVEQALEHFRVATMLINENKREKDDQYRLENLMENASIRELSKHEFVEARLTFFATCDLCDKPIMGMSKQNWKCGHCNVWFHPECKEKEEGLRSCLQRKPLNIREKKLLHQQEVTFLNADDSNIQQLTKGGKKKSAHEHMKRIAAKAKTIGAKFQHDSEEARRSSPDVGSLKTKKCLLCLFQDGLGICHVEREGDRDIFDFIGELPWRVVDEATALEEGSTERSHAFVVRAKFQEWHLAMSTQAEMEAMVVMLNKHKSESTEAGEAAKQASAKAQGGGDTSATNSEAEALPDTPKKGVDVLDFKSHREAQPHGTEQKLIKLNNERPVWEREEEPSPAFPGVRVRDESFSALLANDPVRKKLEPESPGPGSTWEEDETSSDSTRALKSGELPEAASAKLFEPEADAEPELEAEPETGAEQAVEAEPKAEAGYGEAAPDQQPETGDSTGSPTEKEGAEAPIEEKEEAEAPIEEKEEAEAPIEEKEEAEAPIEEKEEAEAPIEEKKEVEAPIEEKEEAETLDVNIIAEDDGTERRASDGAEDTKAGVDSGASEDSAHAESQEEKPPIDSAESDLKVKPAIEEDDE